MWSRSPTEQEPSATGGLVLVLAWWRGASAPAACKVRPLGRTYVRSTRQSARHGAANPIGGGVAKGVDAEQGEGDRGRGRANPPAPAQPGNHGVAASGQARARRRGRAGAHRTSPQNPVTVTKAGCLERCDRSAQGLAEQ